MRVSVVIRLFHVLRLLDLGLHGPSEKEVERAFMVHTQRGRNETYILARLCAAAHGCFVLRDGTSGFLLRHGVECVTR